MALTPEQVAKFRQQYGIGAQGSALVTGTPESSSGFFGSISNAVKTFGTGVVDASKKRQGEMQTEDARTDINPVRKLLRKVGTSAGFIGDVGFEALKLAAPKPVEDIAKAGVEKIAETDTAQNLLAKYEELKTKHPEAMKDVEAVFNIASLLPMEKAVGLGVRGVESGIKAATRGTMNAADAIADEARAVSQSVKTTLAKRAVDPRLKESAERLLPMVDKEKKISPSQRYDEFFQQEQKFKSDIKQDTALSMVGEKIGDSFEDVVKQRREVGKVMDAELKNVGDIQTDISDSFNNFEKKLYEDSHFAYDAENGKLVSTAKQSAMSADDKGLLEKYIADLNTLGAQPTIADLDAFMKRVPSELDVYKSSKNITGTTNGERIIKNHLKELREQFNPEKTGNTALTDYYEARKAYSGLSDFLEEGESFLGKKTQSGDFAKDASLAKSSVQSVLNNGKKDWLIKLEELTGYPALDESVLALQAMKDAGNFRGLSLLETLSDGPLPTSKAGITQKLLDYGITKGTKAFLGSPDKQTRQFLKSLETGGTNSELINSLINPAAGLSTRDVTRFLHPEDKQLMEKFIDHVRIKSDLSERDFDMAERLARHMGIDPDKGLADMANKFDEILSGNRDFTATILPGTPKPVSP